MRLVTRILRRKQRIACEARAENFAYVVKRFAEGVTSSDGQLLEQVVGTELELNRVVIGKSAVGAQPHHPLAAKCASEVRAVRARRNPRRGRYLWSSTGSQSGLHQIGEITSKISNERITIQSLEEIISVIAHIPRLNRGIVRNLAFNSQAPGVHLVGPEVGSDLCLRLSAWIKHTRCKRRS